MRKTLIKILLTSIILLWLWNINGANAGEFTCSLINTEINNYSDYKSKIDNLFTKLSKKDEATKNKYYKKISSVTNKYLQKLDKIKQKKLYTIVWYLKCENDKKFDKLTNDNFFSYKLDKLWNLYAIKLGQSYFVDSTSNDWSIINNIKIIWNFLIYDWTSTGWTIKKVYDIELKKKVGWVIFWKLVWNNIIYGCDTSWYWPWSVQVLNLNIKEFKNFRPSNLNVYSCLLKWKSLYFTLIDQNNNKEDYKYDLLGSELYVNAVRFNDTWWADANYVYSKIFIKKYNKKWTFIKYIWANIEARQNSMYTYFYYNWKLINTVKNKIKNDKYLIYGYNYNDGDIISDNYLTEFYAKKKLDLYSASFEQNNNRIFFVKKTDSWQTNFAYDLITNKLEDWEFEYYWN